MTEIQTLSTKVSSINPQTKKTHHYLKNFEEFKKMYDASIQDPEKFWSKIAEDFSWMKKWDSVLDYNFNDSLKIEWFKGGKTNLSVNALDRHLKNHGNKIAYHWVGNSPGESKKITYQELYELVLSWADMLSRSGVKKGDRVVIYLPMILEAPAALLALSRLGAIHCVVFAGFSAHALKDRIIDSGSTVVITANYGLRGDKTIPLKEITDEALALCEKENHPVQKCLVVKRLDKECSWKEGRDEWVEENLRKVDSFEPVKMDAEDPLFILYTSGSTGKPKGVLHTTAGYMIYVATTFKYIFNNGPEDIFWCTADVGWVTGHSYAVYGPLCNAATSILFEGIPNYPKPDRFWEIIEKYKVTTFYTAPTAIRAIMKDGDEWPAKHDLSFLTLLGSVGEPINPEAWNWYYEHIGNKKCPIVDTWWQTETGGILISPIPFIHGLKPGSAAFPFFGIEPKIVDEKGNEVTGTEGGYLVIDKPWPGMMRTVYKAHDRFKETYFSRFPGKYTTGDGAKKDEDKFYWLLGRIDDVVNVSGHRIGTAEVESALVSHLSVAEAAVVGFPHDIKGQGLFAFVTLKEGIQIQDSLLKELKDQVRKEIGPIAVPDSIVFAGSLPKTRSGKIMRRILRKIVEGERENFGDTSTLADPSVVSTLIDVVQRRG